MDLFLKDSKGRDITFVSLEDLKPKILMNFYYFHLIINLTIADILDL